LKRMSAGQKTQVKMEILESRKLFEKINGMPKAINSGMREIVYKHTLMLEREAKLNVTKTGEEHPQVQTGRLRSSITHDVGIERGEITGKVGTTVSYAPLLEFGTAHHPPYAWLYPALEKIQPIFMKAAYGLRNYIMDWWHK